LVVDGLPDRDRIAVIGDGDEAMPKAAALVTYLRRNMAATLLQLNSAHWTTRDVQIDMAYKANQRKQFDKARARGCDLIVTVRDDGNPEAEKMLLDFKQLTEWTPHCSIALIQAMLGGKETGGHSERTPEGYRASMRIDLGLA
jgi:hypothetical protein